MRQGGKWTPVVALSGILTLLLCGCGSAAKLPDTVVNTSLAVSKDGKVTAYLVDTFDKEYYDIDGLEQMAEEDAREYNAANSGEDKKPVTVDSVKLLDGGNLVQIVQSFEDTESYEGYSEQRLFYGSQVEALAEGISVDIGLVDAADGTPADPAKLEKALSKNHLLITDTSAYIYCPYPVLYVSEGVTVGEDGYVDASQSDGVVTILMKN